MENTLHITSGDCAGGSLVKAGLPGDVFVWHDILYDGPGIPAGPRRILSVIVRCFWKKLPRADWIGRTFWKYCAVSTKNLRERHSMSVSCSGSMPAFLISQCSLTSSRACTTKACGRLNCFVSMHFPGSNRSTDSAKCSPSSWHPSMAHNFPSPKSNLVLRFSWIRRSQIKIQLG